MANLRDVSNLSSAHHADGPQSPRDARVLGRALDRIQGLALRSYAHMPESRILLFRVRTDRAADVLRWLAQLPLTVASPGAPSRQPPEACLNVALTHHGLRVLGAESTLCQAFDRAFSHGAAEERHAALNGDVDDNAPATWTWGSAEKPADLALLIFSRNAANADRFAALHERAALSSGLGLLRRVSGSALHVAADRPDVSGARSLQLAPAELPLHGQSALGDLLLGERDGYGRSTPAPESSAGFSFGHHGSYLVLRELEGETQAYFRYWSELANAYSVERTAGHVLGIDSRSAITGGGLSLLCINADIPRQFEFVQQRWHNHPQLAGRARLRVAGSGYFFLPTTSALKLLCEGAVSEPDNDWLEVSSPREQRATTRLLEALERDVALRPRDAHDAHDGHAARLHGCVEARLQIARDLPEGLRAGLFARPGEYQGFLRFADGEGTAVSAAEPALRGVALKLLNVGGAKLLDGEEHGMTHDFVFASDDAFIAKNLTEFAALVQAAVSGRLSTFRLTHPRFALSAWRASRHRSLLELGYSSVVPQLLGARAATYHLRPSVRAGATPLATPSARIEPDQLRRDLINRLAQGSASFDLLVQLRGAARMSGTDESGVVHRESGELHKLATLELPAQVFDTPERRDFSAHLSFEPWRCLPEHRPLGGVGRARRQVYRMLHGAQRAR
ncbi:MAG: hypothetical protein ABW321_27310 [Polyangiales bacterium]